VNRRNSPPWGDQYPELNDCHLRRGGGARGGAPTDVPHRPRLRTQEKLRVHEEARASQGLAARLRGVVVNRINPCSPRKDKTPNLPVASIAGAKRWRRRPHHHSFGHPHTLNSRVHWSPAPTAPGLPPHLFTEEGSPGGPRFSPSTRLLQRRRSCAPRTGLRLGRDPPNRTVHLTTYLRNVPVGVAFTARAHANVNTNGQRHPPQTHDQLPLQATPPTGKRPAVTR